MVLILTACSELENGYNYFCPDEGIFDVVQESPPIIRFRCDSRDFTLEFLGPDGQGFLEIIRNITPAYEIGVILNENNEVIQIYSTNSGANILRQVWPTE